MAMNYGIFLKIPSFYFFFLFVCLFLEFLCLNAMCAGTLGGQKKKSDPLVLAVTDSCDPLTRVLGTELGSSARATIALNL